MDYLWQNMLRGSNNSNNNTISKNYSENQTRSKVAKYVSLHGKKISHPTLATAEKVAQDEVNNRHFG
ncbi:MAG: hypothetical protein WAM14_01935 [Candidatus Nitrosopolaris sp.]